MNIKLTNIAEDTSPSASQLIGYQELKLISFYHEEDCHRIVGPIPITREVEVALILWIPSLEPDARQTSDFTRLWIKEPFMIRFAFELSRVFRKKGAALAQPDAEQALENATKPIDYVTEQD